MPRHKNALANEANAESDTVRGADGDALEDSDTGPKEKVRGYDNPEPGYKEMLRGYGSSGMDSQAGPGDARILGERRAPNNTFRDDRSYDYNRVHDVRDEGSPANRFRGLLRSSTNFSQSKIDSLADVASGYENFGVSLLRLMCMEESDISLIMSIYSKCFRDKVGRNKSDVSGMEDAMGPKYKQDIQGCNDWDWFRQGRDRDSSLERRKFYSNKFSREERDRFEDEPRRPVWMGAATRHLMYDGNSDWASYLYQFQLCADSLGLGDVEKGRFLQSTLAGAALKLVVDRNREGRILGFREICDILRRRFDSEDERTEAAWLKLDNAFQDRTESLHQWADRLRDIGFRIARGERGAYGAVEPRLVLKFCLAGVDREAGRKAIESGPPRDLLTAVERVQWLQHVDSASRSRSGYENNMFDYSRGMGNYGEDSDYRHRRDLDSPDHRSRAIWSGDGRVPSANFRESRSRDYSPAVRAVGRDREDALETLTKTVSSLVQEVKNLGVRVHAMERASPSPRRRSPSPGNACFGCGATDHFRSDCPKKPSVTFQDQGCFQCGDKGHIRALCPQEAQEANVQGN
ncbi:hypothetical protein EGW08_008360 [Elysia chlorotica]|uniref:CCHC-type domain-containing protein n=1 Tax=Elysia chlorotica TaxID=188477 RepID=A0A433TQJ4_ELYCH|nr:hypothetical protein EGW08_008360 [Elysia chlorotica]